MTDKTINEICECGHEKSWHRLRVKQRNGDNQTVSLNTKNGIGCIKTNCPCRKFTVRKDKSPEFAHGISDTQTLCENCNGEEWEHEKDFEYKYKNKICEKFTPQSQKIQPYGICKCGICFDVEYSPEFGKEIVAVCKKCHSIPREKGFFSIYDNYATDEWIMDLFKDWFDPCPLNANPDFDGLLVEWKDRTFVNPPYSKPLEWVRKAIEENKKDKTIVLLLRVDTSTEWFKLLVENDAKIMWINKRLKHRTGKPANFPSMIAIFGRRLTE